LGDHLQRLRTSGCDISEMIKISESHDRLASLQNVGFPSVALELTQSHSPGLQAAYKKCTFQCDITPDLHTLKNLTAELLKDVRII